jgi:TonB family protein
MSKSPLELPPKTLRRAGLRWAHAAALVLVIAMALPARAADERTVKSRVAPVYPEIAKRMRIEGEVRLSVTVDPDGKVTDVKPISGNHMLSTAAEDAVRKWKFETSSGDSTVDVSLTFALAK